MIAKSVSNRILLAISIGAMVCCKATLAEIENSNSHAGNDAPPAVTRLVPKDWTLESFAYGPLTGKNRKDLVMTVADSPEHGFGNAKARQLIVATSTRAGYKVVARGDHALQLGAGPAGADPFVATEKNRIITELFGGSRYKYTEDYYFALVSNKWLITRYCLHGYDSVSEAHGSNTIDVNVLTGHVVGTMGRDSHKTERVVFSEIFSLRSDKGLNIPAEAPKLKINDASKKCTAVIRSAHTAKEIIIEVTARLAEADDEKRTSVFISDGHGIRIRPKRDKRTVSEVGFAQTLTFALPEDNQFNSPGEDSNKFLNWIVHVDQTNKDNPRVHNKFSTQGTGGKSRVRGGILALTQNSIITLQNANSQNGTFQQAPINPPED